MKEFTPGFSELHIAKVGDGSFILRTDSNIVVTAQNFGQVKKRAAEFFDEGRSDSKQQQEVE